jgi:hypothetical protein
MIKIVKTIIDEEKTQLNNFFNVDGWADGRVGGSKSSFIYCLQH